LICFVQQRHLTHANGIVEIGYLIGGRHDLPNRQQIVIREAPILTGLIGSPN
jgi:hypothetical protein